MVEILLDCNAVVNQADDQGYTALHYAVSIGEAEIVSLLLRHGADVNLGESVSPLVEAVKNCNLGVAKLLLDAGASVNARYAASITMPDTNGITSYHVACKRGHVEIARYFITSVAGCGTGDKNKKNTHLNDGLIIAAFHEQYGVAKLLLEEFTSSREGCRHICDIDYVSTDDVTLPNGDTVLLFEFTALHGTIVGENAEII